MPTADSITEKMMSMHIMPKISRADIPVRKLHIRRNGDEITIIRSDRTKEDCIFPCIILAGDIPVISYKPNSPLCLSK
jgi:hypothetical protein